MTSQVGVSNEMYDGWMGQPVATIDWVDPEVATPTCDVTISWGRANSKRSCKG